MWCVLIRRAWKVWANRIFFLEWFIALCWTYKTLWSSQQRRCAAHCCSRFLWIWRSEKTFVVNLLLRRTRCNSGKASPQDIGYRIPRPWRRLSLSHLIETFLHSCCNLPFHLCFLRTANLGVLHFFRKTTFIPTLAKNVVHHWNKAQV